MAIAYLNKNAASLAAANWSDATGFADNATLVVNLPVGGGSPITAAVDQSGLTSGIDYLDILAGASGQIGTGASPLKVDADTDAATTAADRISNYGSGFVLWLEAGGNDGRVLNLTQGGPNSTNLVGGTFTNIAILGGNLTANESTVITNYNQYGGYSEIAYNATAVTSARILGGTCVLKRLPTTLEVGGSATVIYDPDDRVTSFASTTINQWAGRLDHRRGATPTILSLGGVHDFSHLREPTTPGGTSWDVGGTAIIAGGLLDDSNVSMIFSAKRDIGGAIPI